MLQCEQVAESDLWSVTRPAAVRMLHVGKYWVDTRVWITVIPCGGDGLLVGNECCVSDVLVHVHACVHAAVRASRYLVNMIS